MEDNPFKEKKKSLAFFQKWTIKFAQNWSIVTVTMDQFYANFIVHFWTNFEINWPLSKTLFKIFFFLGRSETGFNHVLNGEMYSWPWVESSSKWGNFFIKIHMLQVKFLLQNFFSINEIFHKTKQVNSFHYHGFRSTIFLTSGINLTNE